MYSDSFYIDHSEYKKYCFEAGIEDEFIQELMLRWFKTIGISYYYKGSEIEVGNDEYKVLNPNWLTNGIYRLILNAPQNNGFIKKEEIKDLLKIPSKNDNLPDVTYTGREVSFILNVMRQFKISYKADGKEFIPCKLPQDTPHYGEELNSDDTLHISWESNYIPDNAIHRLMLERYYDLDFDYVWRTGAVFSRRDNSNTKALARLIFNKFDIFISSDIKEDIYNYYLIFEDSINKIFNDLNISPQHYIHYSFQHKNETLRGKVRHKTVWKQYIDGVAEIFLEETETYVSPEDLLRKTYGKKQLERMKKLDKSGNTYNFYGDDNTVKNADTIQEENIITKGRNNEVYINQKDSLETLIKNKKDISESDLDSLVNAVKEIIDSKTLVAKEHDGLKEILSSIKSKETIGEKWTLIQEKASFIANIITIATPLAPTAVEVFRRIFNL